MPAENYLLFPLRRPGEGSGHLRRCRMLEEQLRERGRPARVVPETDDVLDTAAPVSESVRRAPENENGCGGIPSAAEKGGTLAVLDRRSTSARDLARWIRRGTPVLLDDDGSARSRAPFLIDTIPGRRRSAANLASPALMNLPPKTRRPDFSGRILVSFGGEDPAGLTVAVCRALVNTGAEAGVETGTEADVKAGVKAGVKAARISVTIPPGKENMEEELPPGVNILGAPDNLKDMLGGYGAVVCSYGFTLWEALSAGCGVFTVDPAPYHAMLSRECGFPGTGYVKNGRLEAALQKAWPRDSAGRHHLEKSAESLRARWLEAGPCGRREDAGQACKDTAQSPEELAAAQSSGATGSRREDAGQLCDTSLADVLSRLEAPPPRCLVCGSRLPRIVARFPDRSYYRCSRCSMLGLYRFHLKSNEYGSAYFQEEYRLQYGRTYLEDFDFIRSMGVARLERIGRKALRGGTLLDIGCAFGPFLSAAGEAGYRCFGYDISSEAVAYVREQLGFPAADGTFPQDNPAETFGVDSFDVVSLWYVIEHFPALDEVLRALAGLTKTGGVLAFSTPNGAGVSARRSLKGFLERSPRDHYSIWTPRSARKILARYGFRVYSVRVTGHHPERFPGNPSEGSLLYRFWSAVSRIAGLGDTFEVYARKDKELFQ